MQDILERIKKIEALIEGAKSEGEKNAAQAAKQRILDKYPETQILKNATESKITGLDRWSKKLFNALCRKYKIEPYRYYRQKYTTVMIRCNRGFLDDILWPEYIEYSDKLDELILDITSGIISKIHKDEEEVIIRGELG